jgi:hypothetical protein
MTTLSPGDNPDLPGRIPAPEGGMMKSMPAIPESTCSSITLRLLDHAAKNWPQVKNLHVKCSRGFAYVTAALPGQDEPQPLFRLRYGGSAHSFGFAYYSWAAGRYEDSLLITGSPIGTPQEALDTIATLTVSDTDDEPPTNLQTQPLRNRCRDRGHSH